MSHAHGSNANETASSGSTAMSDTAMSESIPDALDALKSRLADIANLEQAASVLSWDQETQMPAGAAGARAEQLTTLAKLIHQHVTDAGLSELLSASQTPDCDTSARVSLAMMKPCSRSPKGSSPPPASCPILL